MSSFHVRVQFKDNEPVYIDWPDNAPLPQVGDGFVFSNGDRHCVIDTCFAYVVTLEGLAVVEAQLLLDDDDLDDDDERFV